MSPDNYTVVEKVKQLIIQDELNSKSRERDKIYKRSYLYAILREEGWNLSKIGRLFNRDHATVINGLRCYDNYYGNDKIYHRYIKHYESIFRPSIEVPKDSIYDDVMNCHNTTQLRLIKDKIMGGLYDNTTSLLLYVPIIFSFFVWGVEKMLVILS